MRYMISWFPKRLGVRTHLGYFRITPEGRPYVYCHNDEPTKNPTAMWESWEDAYKFLVDTGRHHDFLIEPCGTSIDQQIMANVYLRYAHSSAGIGMFDVATMRHTLHLYYLMQTML